MKNKLIQSLNSLKEISFIYAVWLEWSEAMSKSDDCSDIDIWIDCEDDYENQAFDELKKVLTKISKIDFEYEKEHEHPQIFQRFFHLEKTSEFLIIDVCVQSHSRKIAFTKWNKDEEVKIIFDKKEVIKYKDLDVKSLENTLKLRILELEKTFLFFQVWVKKWIKRNSFLETLYYYQNYVLEPLIELLKIIHEPTKKDFWLKHIERDLPKDIVLKVESFYKVNSIEEIELNLEIINNLFLEKIKEGKEKYLIK